MQERLIIQGGKQLKGEISPAGNKNEALAILAASLLTEEAVKLKNIPDIGDVRDMIEIMRDIGVDVKRLGDHEYLIKALSIKKMELNPELCSRIRGSFLFAAPILVRCGSVKLAKPGGDRIGRRRIDTHLLALEALGARTSEIDEHGGDTVIYGVKGPITVFLPDTVETFQVEEGDVMYLPPRTKHQFINYNSGPIIGYFAIAKDL